MTVAGEGGRGRNISYETASTTIEIDRGRAVELDSSGNVILPTTTPGPCAGVSVSKVAARTTATKERILVQTSGLVPMCCAANEAFAYGELAVSVTLTGKATSHAADASTLDPQKIIGKVHTPDATTEGTTLIVVLWP